MKPVRRSIASWAEVKPPPTSPAMTTSPGTRYSSKDPVGKSITRASGPNSEVKVTAMSSAGIAGITRARTGSRRVSRAVRVKRASVGRPSMRRSFTMRHPRLRRAAR